MQERNGHRIALHSFGCKLNQSEIEGISLAFAAGGFEVVEPGDEADVYVVNTCTVTGEADRQLRQWLRSVRRRQPSSMLVAVGCAVERDAPHVQELADLVITNAGKGDVVALFSETRAEFYLADLGILSSGAIAAALYTSYQTSDQTETLRACGARAGKTKAASTTPTRISTLAKSSIEIFPA